ncbi:MAG: hypothetical protein AAGC63_00350, partial [Propionicimonas sp.]|nr:hypothetical protein [Propionicimonas sp.]
MEHNPPGRPSDQDLRWLYLDERLSAREIGRRFGVSKTSVVRWLTVAGIDRREANRGMGNRGVEAPGAADLERLVHIEHRSYREIGEQYGV